MSDADPFASWGDRTPLYDEAGRLLLLVTLTEDLLRGRPWADGAWRPDDVSPDVTARAALRQLGGHAFSTSDLALVAVLRRAGAEELRHAHVMAHDVRDVSAWPLPHSPSNLRVHSLTPAQLMRHAEEIAAIRNAAYSAGHPDHRPSTVEDSVASVHATARGEILGPMLSVSQVAVQNHQIMGVALVVDRPGQAPEGGPWVLDIFREPTASARGCGRALLLAVLSAAREAGLPSIGLAVSHGNAAAIKLYESLGFVDHLESWTLALPGSTDRPDPPIRLA